MASVSSMKPDLFLDSIGDTVELGERSRKVAATLNGKLPRAADLTQLAQAHGVNMATMVLYRCLLEHELHGKFIDDVNTADCSATVVPAPPELFVVPGLFYLDKPSLGSDARLLIQIAKRFGINTTIIPTRSLGGVAENVEVIRDFLRSHNDKPYWLASISRGSAEVKWLLYQDHNAQFFSNLQGWVGVNGIVNGSRVFDKARDNALWRCLYRSVARFNRINPDIVDEMSSSHAQWSKTYLPNDVSYINVVSLPMSWDVSAPVQARFHNLSRLGPNDGAVLLSDYLLEPGLYYPVLGADHLMRYTQLSRLFYQLFNRLIIDQTALPKVISQ